MDLLRRLSDLQRKVSSLADEIEQLRRVAQALVPPQPPDQDLQKPPRLGLGPIASYLALGPRMESDELLRLILECAMYVVRAGGAGLTLFDPQKGKLVFKAAIGDGAEGIIGYEVPLEGSQHGLAFATREVQSSTPLHIEIEKAAKARFRNVLVAPLIVEGDPVGTMSAVNKRDGDHFTADDMKAYKLFADLAALVVRQRLREQLLRRIINGESVPLPSELEGLGLGEGDQLLMGIMDDLSKLAEGREDLLHFCKQLTGLLLELSSRLRWHR